MNDPWNLVWGGLLVLIAAVAIFMTGYELGTNSNSCIETAINLFCEEQQPLSIEQ